jgi:hypothetical protein
MFQPRGRHSYVKSPLFELKAFQQRLTPIAPFTVRMDDLDRLRAAVTGLKRSIMLLLGWCISSPYPCSRSIKARSLELIQVRACEAHQQTGFAAERLAINAY